MNVQGSSGGIAPFLRHGNHTKAPLASPSEGTPSKRRVTRNASRLLERGMFALVLLGALAYYLGLVAWSGTWTTR